MDITQVLFIALMIALYVFQNFFCKTFSYHYKGNAAYTTPVLTVFGGIVVAIISFFFSGMKFEAQGLTVVLGILNATAFYGYNYFFLRCSATGPYSVLMVFAIFGGIAFPSATKWIGFEEAMTGPAICFLVLVMIAVYLVSKKPGGDSTSKITIKFILSCLGLCASNGIYNSILVLQQEFTGADEKEELIIITFICVAIISLLSLIFQKADLKAALKQTKKSALHLIAYALCTALAINSLVIILLLDINTGVLYTIQSASIMLLSVVLSMICFKEKLTRVNVIGCILMAIGLVGITVCEKVTFAQLGEILTNLIK